MKLNPCGAAREATGCHYLSSAEKLRASGTFQLENQSETLESDISVTVRCRFVHMTRFMNDDASSGDHLSLCRC